MGRDQIKKAYAFLTVEKGRLVGDNNSVTAAKESRCTYINRKWYAAEQLLNVTTWLRWNYAKWWCGGRFEFQISTACLFGWNRLFRTLPTFNFVVVKAPNFWRRRRTVDFAQLDCNIYVQRQPGDLTENTKVKQTPHHGEK